MRRVVFVGFVTLTLVEGACGAERAPDSTFTAKSALVGGVDSTAAYDGVVLVTTNFRDPPALFCSGTLVAPNLVMLARHCIQKTIEAEPFGCYADGTLVPNASGSGYFLDVAAPASVRVSTMRAITRSPEEAATAKRLFATTSDSICTDDLAFIELDRRLEGVPIYPIRLTRETRLGEKLTIVGFGQQGADARERSPRQERSGVPVLGVGAMNGASASGVRPRAFTIGNVVCEGDSGGPAFAEETGAIAGVFSTFDGSCAVGERPAYYSRIAPHADFIREVFAAVGAEPWLEGEPAPWLARDGARCAHDGECRSGHCGVDAGVCVAPACDAGACAAEVDAATPVDTEADAGPAPPAAVSDDVRRRSGCAAAPGTRDPTPSVAALAMLALASVRRTRRRTQAVRTRLNA